jgi:hypothetical protein
MLMFHSEKNRVIGSVTIEKEITVFDIENIMVTALESGSHYWVGLENKGDLWEQKPKGIPYAIWATKLIIESHEVKLFDIEYTEDDEDWVLTLDKLLKGIKLNAIERPFDSDLENMDADTADCILQFALFGKVVFG